MAGSESHDQAPAAIGAIETIDTSGVLAAALERLGRESMLALLEKLVTEQSHLLDTAISRAMAGLRGEFQTRIDELETRHRAELDPLTRTIQGMTTHESARRQVRRQIKEAASPQPASSSFGQRLRQLLAERDMSQAELARRTDLSTSKVGRMVRDKRIPRPGEPERLAAALGITRDALCRGFADMPA